MNARLALLAFCTLLILSFTLAVLGCTRDAEHEISSPNFLLITVDDMNWDSVGVYGSAVHDVTPNIDRLASEGIRFDYAHVNVAICQPSRAAFVTGLFPHRSGAMGFESIHEKVPTLFERLKKAGYRIGILSKVDHTAPTRAVAWDFIVESALLNGGRDPAAFYKNARAFFAEAKASRQPFFLVANIEDPHLPFANTLSEKQHAENKWAGMSDPPPPVSRVYAQDEIVPPGFLPDIPGVRRDLANYFNSVHRADVSVGRIIRALEDEKLAENTMITFVSDNGMAMPFVKSNVYLHSTKTPWIVRWPGTTEPGSRDREHVISAVDFAPTILDAAGLEPFPDTDGRSFLPLLRGEPQENRDYVFTFLFRLIDDREFPMRSVQGVRFGYIFNAWSNGEASFENKAQGGLAMSAMRHVAQRDEKVADRIDFLLHRVPEEFYDYQSDPDALHNLMGSPEMEEEIAKYRELLRRNMRNTDDPLLDPFETYLTKQR